MSHEGNLDLEKETGLAAGDEPYTTSMAGVVVEGAPISDGNGSVTDGQEREIYDEERRIRRRSGRRSDSEVENHNRLPYSKARCIALVATVSGASFATTYSVQSVVIILPSIGRELQIPDARLQWIVSAYTLAFGCCLLFWGRIADIYGKKKVFIYGTAWVSLSALINPFVPNEIAFDLFRGLQGVGAAANVPTAIGILGTTFRPGKAKTYAFAAYGAGAPLGSIFGNLLAGFVASYASWRWVFGTIAILTGTIAVAGVFIIPPPATPTRHHAAAAARATVDWAGAFLITVGLFALLFALTEGNVVGWRTAWVWVLVVLSLLVIAGFVAWQARLERGGARAPLMKVSMFRSRQFSAAMVIMALFFSAFNGFIVYATYFYQSYQGLDALQTTLRFIPTGVAGVVTSFAVAHALGRIPTHVILLFGNLCVSLCSLLFAIPIPPDTSYFAYGLLAMMLSVFGADTTWPSLTLFTSHVLPHEDQALGGALVNAVGQVGRSIGLAIATAVQTAVMASHRGVGVQDAGPLVPWDEASLAGLRAACWFNCAVGACSFVVVGLAFRGAGIAGSPAEEVQMIGEKEGEQQAREKGGDGLGAEEDAVAR